MRSTSIYSSLVLASFSLVLSTLPVHAATDTSAKPPAVADIAPLKEFQDRTKSRVEYVGSKSGLDLWMAVQGTQLQLIYTTADKQGMLLNGMLYSAGAKDETSLLQRDFILNHPEVAEDILKSVGDTRQAGGTSPAVESTPAAAAAPAPATSSPAPATAKPAGRSEALWNDLSVAHFIPFGPLESTKLVYVFADPTCEHCHALWQKLQPALKDQDLQVRLVPVAIQGKESEKLVAQILSQTDPAAAWGKIIAGQPLVTPTNITGQAAQAINQKLMTNYKIGSTPMMVYRQAASGKIRIMLGNPDDITVFFTDIGLTATPAAADKGE